MSNLLSRDDILSLEAIPLGMVRHTVVNGDGTPESVAINNLLALKTVICTDFSGNQYGAYFVVPDSYWKKMQYEWKALYRNDWTWLPTNEYGGYLGIMPYVTVYVGGTDKVILKPDVGALVYSFEVGAEHHITMSKSELIEKYGYERVGYDTRVVYVPWWESYGCAYAPPGLLLTWGDYKPAVALLENPPNAALKQWYNQGLIAAPKKDAVVALIEGRKYLPAGEVDIDYTIIEENKDEDSRSRPV